MSLYTLKRRNRSFKRTKQTTYIIYTIYVIYIIRVAYGHVGWKITDPCNKQHKN